MFFVGGRISDALRGKLRNNDPSYSPPPDAGRMSTPKWGQTVPADVGGIQLSKPGRKRK